MSYKHKEGFWEISEDEFTILEPQLQAIYLLSDVKAGETNKILDALSCFNNMEEAVIFANKEIQRYTTRNFSEAWKYEEVKRLAMACGKCKKFSGKYGECKYKNIKDCQLKLEDAFYNHKTVVQEISEELNISYIRV